MGIFSPFMKAFISVANFFIHGTSSRTWCSRGSGEATGFTFIIVKLRSSRIWMPSLSGPFEDSVDKFSGRDFDISEVSCSQGRITGRVWCRVCTAPAKGVNSGVFVLLFYSFFIIFYLSSRGSVWEGETVCGNFRDREQNCLVGGFL